MRVHIIRTDGREEHVDVSSTAPFRDLGRLLDVETFDVVNLRDGRVMLVDDNGYDTSVVEHPATPNHPFTVEVVPVRGRKPVNAMATALYHGVCVPGTTHQIVGDVAIARDEDFA